MHKEGTFTEEVKEETKQYKTSNDLIANWIDDRVIESEEFATFDDLYDDWKIIVMTKVFIKNSVLRKRKLRLNL